MAEDSGQRRIALKVHGGRRTRTQSCMMTDDVETWLGIFYVLVGAVCSAYFTRNAPNGIARIKSLFPGYSEVAYARVDFLFGLAICTIVSYGLFAPENPKQALFAGFTSVATLKQFVTRSRR